MLTDRFSSAQEDLLAEEFISNGYVIREVEDRSALDAMRHEIILAACEALDTAAPADEGSFLDNIHRIVPVERLNEFRLRIYRGINSRAWLRPTYFRLAQRTIEALVGNELAMQNRINFSIQMPEDRTSLLDIHADVFGGETPYQVVEWLPLVSVRRTKSMFILPRSKSEEVTKRLAEFGTGGMPALYEAVKKDLIWLDIPYGSVLVFSPNFLHGNVVNEERTTRWSMNCRLTGLFTPYGTAEKRLGSYYLPVSPRPVTRLGMAYEPPSGFRE